MDKRKKAAAAAVTVAAVAGMVTGSVFDHPGDLLPEASAVTSVQIDDDDDASEAEERQKGVSARVREWVLRLPVGVRALVGVPLWCLGWVLLSALSTLWMGAGVPVLSCLIKWLCLAAVLLAVFAATTKAAFPRVPLRRLLRPGNILFLVGTSLVLAVADMALPSVWQGYNAIYRTVWRVGAACLLAFSCCMELRYQGKHAAPKAVRAASPSGRSEVEEAALRLADSVCPPRK